MRRARSGFTLILVLLLTSLFLVMGIGFLSQRQGQQQAVASARLSLQAKELARAGLLDAHIKLSKQHRFPPLAGPSGQESFSYHEDVTDFDDNRIGSYTVNLAMDFTTDPYRLVRITSVGQVGDLANPTAQVTLHAELDISADVRRSDPPVPNPNRFRILSVRQESRF